MFFYMPCIAENVQRARGTRNVQRLATEPKFRKAVSLAGYGLLLWCSLFDLWNVMVCNDMETKTIPVFNYTAWNASIN